MSKNVKINNLICSTDIILIHNILRELGLNPTLNGTKFLNKSIQVFINSNNEFIILEDIYKIIAVNNSHFNSTQIRNAIKYAIDNRNEKKSITNFEKIFGYKYDEYYFTNKTLIEEIARIILTQMNK